MDKNAQDNRANQKNPNYEHHQGKYTGQGDHHDLKNHGEQLNPNNKKFGGGDNSGGQKKN